jgi:FkbM family methyltransferase
MSTKHRVRLGDLDLCSIDPLDRDAEYIYGEIFRERVYAHSRFAFAEPPVVVDVGANIGLFAIWAARMFRPRRILAYEASPTTFEYLVENVAEHIDPAVSLTECFNLAVSRHADDVLELYQPPLNSGHSTVLDVSTLHWNEEMQAKTGLQTHRVRTTTISREIALRGLERIDLLKIDVEGHFMEVLDGIGSSDFERIRNIALEAEYVEALGHTADAICGRLREHGYEVESQNADPTMIYAWRA